MIDTTTKHSKYDREHDTGTLSRYDFDELLDCIVYDVTIANPAELKDFDFNSCELRVSYLHCISDTRGMETQPLVFTKICTLPIFLRRVIVRGCHVLLALLCLRLRETCKGIDKYFTLANINRIVEPHKVHLPLMVGIEKTQFGNLCKIVTQADKELSDLLG